MGTQTGLACRTGPAQRLPPGTTHTPSCREVTVWMVAGTGLSSQCRPGSGKVAAPHLQERPGAQPCGGAVSSAGVGGWGAEKVPRLRQCGLPGGGAGPVRPEPLWRVWAPVSPRLLLPPTRQGPGSEESGCREGWGFGGGALCTFQWERQTPDPEVRPDSEEGPLCQSSTPSGLGVDPPGRAAHPTPAPSLDSANPLRPALPFALGEGSRQPQIF